MWWLLGFVVVIFVLLRIYYENAYSYWRKLGAPSAPYSYIVGVMGPMLMMTKSIGCIYTEIYRKFEGYSYVGFYKFTQPGLVIRDPSLIRDIFNRNFASFHDNDFHINEESDMVLGKNPFVLKGDRWKTVRAQITPVFSSGKIKMMLPLIQENSKKLLKYLNDIEESTRTDGLDVKNLAARFTCDNVASCAFGVDGRSFDDVKGNFLEHGAQFTAVTTWNGIKLIIITAFPTLGNIFKVKFTDESVTDFLRNVIDEALAHRKENGVVRNDFLDFMTELRAKINNEAEFNSNDILAHAAGFFIDGFETSSAVISYALYELARNEDSQEKLLKEIKAVLKKHNGEFTYEAVQEMHYLDCVFKESIRMHPPGTVLVRICTETFTLPPPYANGKEVTIQPGTPIVLPAMALQTDATYFPEPERFKPERFFDENSKNLNKGTYFPFGDGPRMCLGMKFGVLQSKIAIAVLVANYKLIVSKKTKEPLEIDPRHFILAAVGGLWINFTKRED